MTSMQSLLSMDVRLEVAVWKGLSNIQDFDPIMRSTHLHVLHVKARSSLHYAVLCQGILLLACSAILSFWGHQAKSCGLEGSFEHPGVRYQHNSHISCLSCCCGSFLLIQFDLASRNL